MSQKNLASRRSAALSANRGDLSLAEAAEKGALDIWAKNHKKFGSALLTLAGDALSLGLLHGTAQTVVTLLVTALGALGVKQLDNTVDTSDV